MLSQTGLVITAAVACLYGVSFAVLPARIHTAPWWKAYVMIGAVIVLALFVFLVVIPSNDQNLWMALGGVR